MPVANLFGPDLGIVVLVILAVLVFGSQAPKIARNLGMAGKEFRKAQQEADDEHAAKTAADAAKVAAVPAIAVPPVAIPPVSAEDKITLSRSELDALLAAREAQAKESSSGS
jgi:Sec-independent protein translocase protein TatA